MKRTKDGGALIESIDGKMEKLTKEEFERSGSIRNLIRVLIIVGVVVIETLINSDYLMSLGVIFIMVGWRLSTGW